MIIFGNTAYVQMSAVTFVELLGGSDSVLVVLVRFGLYLKVI